MTANSMTVLYIDDDEGLGVLLRKNLARRGIRVLNALDRHAGLALLDEGGVDAIALDHYLLGETGLDILPDILERPEHPPVVYVTGAGDTSIAVEALKQGADDYVTKNISQDFFELLIVALSQAVERSRLRREQALAQDAIRLERDRAELLLREVNHRVANSLSLAASLVRMQTSLIKDPIAIDALTETQVRITAIGNVHRHLYANKEVGKVEIRSYLANLMDELQSSMKHTAGPSRLALTAEPLTLPTDQVVTLGLLVSELVTNAFKYAYPPGEEGEVRVILRSLSADIVELVVEDDGAGFDPTAPAKGTGLGTKILHAMSMTLGGDLGYDSPPRGTRARLQFPVR